MDGPGEVASSAGGGSSALYAALRSIGVEPTPLQDMIIKDTFVRDFDVSTASVQALLESVEENLANTEVPRHEGLSFELQRIATLTERLEIKRAERVQEIEVLDRRKAEAQQKMQESIDRCEEKLQKQLKRAAALDVFSDRYQALHPKVKAETEKADPAAAAEQPAQEASAPASADAWAQEAWQQADWQQADWQQAAWAGAAGESWEAQGAHCGAEVAEQWAEVNDGGFGIYEVDAAGPAAQTHLNAAAPEFTPNMATPEAEPSPSELKPELAASEVEPEPAASEPADKVNDDSDSDGENPWDGLT